MAFVQVQSLDRYQIDKLKKAAVSAELPRALKTGVELLAKAIRDQAQKNADRTIRVGKPYNRPHRGGNADVPSYFDGFYYAITGSRLNWAAEVGNRAKDQHIQEGGRRKGARGPNMRNAATRRKIRGWAADRGLLSGHWFERKQRRGKNGRFLKKRKLSEKQVLFLIARAIPKRGRPANRNLQRAALQVQQRSRGYNQFAKALDAAMR